MVYCSFYNLYDKPVSTKFSQNEGILYGSIISGELTEAAIEEATLNAISEPCSKYMPLCFRIIQFSLRLRQLVLPWFIGTATIGVILTESFEPKNILLNFLLNF